MKLCTQIRTDCSDKSNQMKTKYIAQVIVLGVRIIGRAFARVLQQEYTASKTAAQRGGNHNPRASANVNLKLGMTLQEAKQILNVNTLNQQEIKKNCKHLFQVNDCSKSGSLYLQSKDKLYHQTLVAEMKPIINQRCFYSQTSFSNVFSENSKKIFLKSLNRKAILLDHQKISKKEAAVLVPFCLVDNKPSVLLTVRSALVGRNKGDVSFPGGMKEVSDKDAIHVALRETKEEIGISVKTSEIWTTMNPLLNRTGDIAITPVIAFLGNLNIESCNINKHEVDSVFALTLESLCDPNNWQYTQYRRGYTLPVYLNGECRIWGLTAIILHVILQALLPDKYKSNLVIYNKIKITTNEKK